MLDRFLACAALAFHRPLPTQHGRARGGRLSPILFDDSSKQRQIIPHYLPTTAVSSTTTTTLFLTKKSSGSSKSNEAGKASNSDIDSFSSAEELPLQDTNTADQAAEMQFLRNEIDHVAALQEIVEELEEFADFPELEDDDLDTDDDDDDTDQDGMVWSEEALSAIFGELPDDDYGDEEDYDVDNNQYFNNDDDDDDDEDEFNENYMQVHSANDFRQMEERIRMSAAADLERALLEGVVPVSAGVGNECLPGDYGFDPLNLAEKDYFRQVQQFLLNLLPERSDDSESFGSSTAPSTVSTSQNSMSTERPKALILRDLREAEIRHGRLAMLAAMFWPLQEMLDRFLLDPDQVGPLIYGPVTLPYFPLLMTAIMLMLGYLDVYAQAVKDMDSIGEAFMPADCFWDPLRILQGAPDRMKRNMQERELLNGRVAMLAFAAFLYEEAITHLPLIEIGQNDLLLEPPFEVPFIQRWLDSQFSVMDL